MNLVSAVTNELMIQVVRILTGRLFTKDQIKKISTHSVGKYFADIFPEDEDQKSQRERMALAQSHIESASTIISDMKGELDAQKETLESLIAEIEEKKSTAQKYAELASTNKNAVAAMKSEMEEALRQELIRQSEEGRLARRLASAFLWLITLVAGAALGAYFKDIIAIFLPLL